MLSARLLVVLAGNSFAPVRVSALARRDVAFPARPAGTPGVLACPGNEVQTNMHRATAMPCNYILRVARQKQRLVMRRAPMPARSAPIGILSLAAQGGPTL